MKLKPFYSFGQLVGMIPAAASRGPKHLVPCRRKLATVLPNDETAERFFDPYDAKHATIH